MTQDELKEKMKNKPDDSKEYKTFFNKEIKSHLAGYWFPIDNNFDSVEVRSNVWLVGGFCVDFNQNKSICFGTNSSSY